MNPWLLAFFVSLAGMGQAASAAEGLDFLKSKCGECHALAKPENPTLDRLWERKGPDLHYAGNKFNKDWLVSWLQNPTVIRPAGVMYSKAVKAQTGRDPDVIDESLVPRHQKLSKGDAEKAATALMGLKSADSLVVKGAYKKGPVNKMFASMLFNKLRGCSSCHASAPGKGGTSGPELYTANERLNLDYVVAYIKDPQKFDPHIWMPTLGLNDGDIQKITGFITTLSAGEKK